NVQMSVASNQTIAESRISARRVPNAAPKNSAISALMYSHAAEPLPNVAGRVTLARVSPTAAPRATKGIQKPTAIRNPPQTPLQARRAIAGGISSRLTHPDDTRRSRKRRSGEAESNRMGSFAESMVSLLPIQKERTQRPSQ